MELLPFVDILKVFNNPINEEQAWAVCYQCAHFLLRNPSQEFYQDVYDSGIHSIWLSRHGDVLLRRGPSDPNGSGKGPPQHSPPHHGQPTPSCSTTASYSSRRTTTTEHHRNRPHVLASETDAVQALGTAIFEALDYGIDHSEERQLSPELEAMIVSMTSCAPDDPEAASNGDDEGIEKDADVDTRCTVADVIKMCVRHLSSKQDASHHYKAVCRALATEAGELFTFLDKVAAGKELVQAEDEDARRLEELQRADWACLWVQVMRSLRQGVRLKKVEHVHLPPLEYELTPFEMILEDIRSRRYTLTKIMVNGDIPHKVKNDAHAVILNFIRSRPPLKKVDERKLKPKPAPPPDPHQLLLNEIRSRPKLRPVKDGKLVVESSPGSSPRSQALVSKDLPKPVKRVIKPDFNLLLNNSFEESSDEEDRSNSNSPATPVCLQQQQPRSDSLTMTPPQQHPWHRAVTRESLLREGRGARLQRRHTITICEAPVELQVELPVLQEEEEEQSSPVRDSSSRHAAALPRSSHSDNDLQGHMTINLRQGQGLVRRASFDNRRSLPSQASVGLSSIPELEDDGKAGGRGKAKEQCPPPNLSPPCKGRAKAGLAIVGMKPSGGPYHPSSLRSYSAAAVAVPVPSPAAPKSSSVPASMQHASSTSVRAWSNQHVSTNSHASLSQSFISPPLLPSGEQRLDRSSSCQSPGYRKKFPRSSSGTKTTHEKDSDRLSHWRGTSAQSTKTEDKQVQGKDSLSPSARRWAGGGVDLNPKPSPSPSARRWAGGVADLNPEPLTVEERDSSQEAIHKRLSLDAGMSLYYDEALRQDGHDSLPSSPHLGRDSRVSVGLDRGVRGRMGFRRTKTPEEEERVIRWRALQEDEREARLSGQPARRAPLEPESTDVLQQRLAGEEARFDRWRRLEEDTLLRNLTGYTSVSTSAIEASPVTMPKRWQNPVECLSLTLEEVTHIRSVLTKAELESLMSHADLYQQVAKNKICFTCKTTRFALFGEWGTKCKFCKRTVCSKCLRKMNVPADHFRNIPVYALSPTPLSQEMEDFIHTYIRGASPPSVPATREHSPSGQNQGKPASLQRSQSALVPSRPASSSLKGPVLAICCDCKSMVMEIIRATRASLTLLSSQSQSSHQRLNVAARQYLVNSKLTSS